MTLQQILLKLSNNKEVAVKCDCEDGNLTIKILESFNYGIIEKIVVDLHIVLKDQQLVMSKLKNYIPK